MHLDFNALPALIALAILVAVFAAISHEHTRERVHLWLTGWVLVLLRALVQFLRAGQDKFELAVGLCLLELAGAAFLISVAPRATTPKRQLLLASVLALPALTYTLATLNQVTSPFFYYSVVAIGTVAGIIVLFDFYRTVNVYVGFVTAATVLTGGLLFWMVSIGRLEYGVQVILMAMNFFAAGLFWYGLRRMSAGVLATVFGFVSWGASFPLALLLRRYAPAAQIDVEIWDIPKYMLAIGMIVTLLEEQILQSEHMAHHDALTGLPNRRLLKDRLLQALAHAARNDRKVAVLLLDLDEFKAVNDTCGHRIGDGVLQEVAARLSARLRASDTLARTGGDEFTVISEVSDVQGARTLVWAMEAALVQPLRVERRTLRLGVSVGYALYPDDAVDPEDLCALADRAMYAAKRGGRSLRSSADSAS